MTERNWRTVEETAAYLQVCAATVYRLIKSGQLEGYKIGGLTSGWRITNESIEKLAGGGK